MGELDDFLAELQAERLPRAPGAAPDAGSMRDPTGAKSLESALELLMGDRSSGGGAPGACAGVSVSRTMLAHVVWCCAESCGWSARACVCECVCVCWGLAWAFANCYVHTKCSVHTADCCSSCVQTTGRQARSAHGTGNSACADRKSNVRT